MKRFIAYLGIIVALFMVSCKCPECLTTTETEKIVEVHTRDTAIITKADSASVRALLRCDSAYNVVLDELVTMQGDRINATIKTTRSTTKGLQIELDCKEDSLRNEIQLRDSIISMTKNNTTIIREKYVPSYYKFCSWGFWILLVILLLMVGWKIAKIYLKTQIGGIL